MTTKKVVSMALRVGKGRFEKGPYVLFGRGHCGGRILSKAYHRNGIYMGELSTKNQDTIGMGLNNERMVTIVKNAYRYPDASASEQQELEQILAEQVESLRREAGGKPFGWKMGVSIFCIEILLRTYPEARVIHLIRDGRDVCLSRINARFRPKSIQLPEYKIAVFGRSGITHYKEALLEKAVEDEALRNELEMIHWKTATEFGLRGRAFPVQYLEVRYEALCRHPVATLEKIFAFIDVPMKPEVRRWAGENIHTNRIGKWKGREAALEEAFRLGEPTLTELGYR